MYISSIGDTHKYFEMFTTHTYIYYVLVFGACEWVRVWHTDMYIQDTDAYIQLAAKSKNISRYKKAISVVRLAN